MARTSHDCMRDALGATLLTDAEIVARVCSEAGVAADAAQAMIDRLRAGGKCTLVLSFAIICLDAERDLERRQATLH